MIKRYYRKNKSLPSLRHMVVKMKNATKLCYEKYFCIVYSICEEIDTQMSYTKVLPHGNSSKTEHPYIRTFQYMLNAERQRLESNKPHKVYEDLVAAADPFTTTSQSEELHEIHNVQVDREIRYYLLNHIFKASGKFNNRDFSLHFSIFF